MDAAPEEDDALCPEESEAAEPGVPWEDVRDAALAARECPETDSESEDPLSALLVALETPPDDDDDGLIPRGSHAPSRHSCCWLQSALALHWARHAPLRSTSFSRHAS
jgi:hypothetical protein